MWYFDTVHHQSYWEREGIIDGTRYPENDAAILKMDELQAERLKKESKRRERESKRASRGLH